MSYRDTFDISTTSRNGIFRAVTGERGEQFVAELHVGRRVLMQAIADLLRFCNYGLITMAGVCKPWPHRTGTDKQGHRRISYMMINGSRDPHEHRKLKEFFVGGHGQELCDWIGFQYPAADTFWRIVKREGARK